MTGTKAKKEEVKPISEGDLLKELDLPSPPKFKKGKSHRISTWIEKGLNYSTNSRNRYFLKSDVEAFLHRIYGISIEQFRADLKFEEQKPYISAIYL